MSGFTYGVQNLSVPESQINKNFIQGVAITNLDSLAPTTVSAFYGSGVLAIQLTNNGPTGTQVGSTLSITTTKTGYVSAHAHAGFLNTGNTEHLISFYITIDGTTSFPTSQVITKKLSGSDSYVSSSLVQRTTTTLAPGTYNIQMYAYTGDATTTVSCEHVDVIAYGNIL